MFDDVCPSLSGKKIALFGSYGWGDGEWMRDWKDVCVKAGANVVDELMVNEYPDDDGIASCKMLGSAIC